MNIDDAAIKLSKELRQTLGEHLLTVGVGAGEIIVYVRRNSSIVKKGVPAEYRGYPTIVRAIGSIQPASHGAAGD